MLTGGRFATFSAVAAGTPCACRPAVKVSGSERASPATIREKNTPIDSAVPEFWNVERMPEATPRWFSGTLLMIAEVLGAEKTPWPIPLSTSRLGEGGVGEVDREREQPEERRRDQEEAAGREQPRPEPVGEVARRRPGEQEPGRQRQRDPLVPAAGRGDGLITADPPRSTTDAINHVYDQRH